MFGLLVVWNVVAYFVFGPPSEVEFNFPKFVGQPAKFPIPTAPTCGIRKAMSAKEVVYITVDDGPSPSGRLNLLNAMDQLNN
ncbi:hypothetical protein DYB34_009279, partial [Aphanomyces astaci]